MNINHRKLNLAIFLSICFFIASLISFIFNYRFIVKVHEEYLASTKGIIIDKHRKEGSAGRPITKYRVEYKVKNISYFVTNEEVIEPPMSVGQSLPVRYNPIKPEEATINIYSETYQVFYFIVPIMVVTFLTAIILIYIKIYGFPNWI